MKRSDVEPVGYVALVRGNRAYRLLWLGQVVSLLGDWFSLVASATLVASLTGSGLAVGGLFVMRLLPPFLISPFAGVAADRYDRKYLLIIADLVRMVTVLGFLLVDTAGEIWLLYALTAVQLALGGVFFPTRNALLPKLVSARELGSANALSSVTWSVMLAFGAALGGVVAGHFGVKVAFVIDSSTYLLSALLLLGIRGETRAPPRSDRSLVAAIREYVDGLRYLMTHREVLFTAMHKGLFGLTMGGSLQVILVTLAHDVFTFGGDGNTSLGLMYAITGVGTGVGPIVMRRFTGDSRAHLRRSIGFAYLLVSLGIVLISPLASFALVLFGLLVRGIGGGINWVFSTQLLMMAVPDDVRGRVFSTEFAFFTLAQAIGTVFGGWFVDWSGLELQAVILIIAVLPLLPGVLWVLWLRRLESVPVER